MVLDRIVIEDFKSISKINLNIHDITCLVGKNESGKSAILDAISCLNSEKYNLSVDKTNKRSKRYENDELPIVTGYFLLTEEDNEYLEMTLPFEYDSKGKSIENNFNFKWIRIKVNNVESSNIELEFVHGNNKAIKLKDKFQHDKSVYQEYKSRILYELIPNIELFTQETLQIKPVTVQELISPMKENESFRRLLKIGGINDLAVLNNSNPERVSDKLHLASQNITELLQKNYKQDKTLRVEINYHGNQFLLKFRDSSNRSYSLNDRSVGFQYFFAFLVNKTYMNKLENQKNILLLDEPGVSLHPEGARDLVKLFEEIAKTDQIVYTTHNPFLVYRNKPDNLILVKKDNDGTQLLTKVYTNKYQILRKELGLLLNDSFLVNDINIVVEGNADKYILHYLIHELIDFESLTWIHIYSADTASEVVPSVRYLNSLDLKGIVLLDSDTAGKNEIAKPKFKTHVLENKNWDFLTLNEVVKDSNERTIEDMLEQEFFINAYNSYYTSVDDSVDWKKDFVELSVKKYKTPVLDTINKHFNEFADGGINKIAILRQFTKMFPYNENIEKYKDLVDVLRVIQAKISKF
ncbi:AAA family ATPase [Flavobacterium sp.]|uniref:ATP-dependent nuclease n=1 Tax=Flavobacterium sp. TaxID=239 RepID=UPI0025B7CFE7|nr:AAA family ATPase [Flavobacterium sp.]